jgi:hypothetical protein
LIALIRAYVLTGARIHGDNTVVPVLAKSKTITRRLWTLTIRHCGWTSCCPGTARCRLPNWRHEPNRHKPANETSAGDSFNQICTVRIELLDTNPLIWREVQVPTSITLRMLHDIVEIAMG